LLFHKKALPPCHAKGSMCLQWSNIAVVAIALLLQPSQGRFLEPAAVEIQGDVEQIMLAAAGGGKKDCQTVSKALVAGSEGSKEKVSDKLTVVCSGFKLPLDYDACSRYQSILLSHMHATNEAHNLQKMDFAKMCKEVKKDKAAQKDELKKFQASPKKAIEAFKKAAAKKAAAPKKHAAPVPKTSSKKTAPALKIAGNVVEAAADAAKKVADAAKKTAPDATKKAALAPPPLVEEGVPALAKTGVKDVPQERGPAPKPIEWHSRWN